MAHSGIWRVEQMWWHLADWRLMNPLDWQWEHPLGQLRVHLEGSRASNCRGLYEFSKTPSQGVLLINWVSLDIRKTCQRFSPCTVGVIGRLVGARSTAPRSAFEPEKEGVTR
jgi:hypothetical protein